MVIIEGVTAKKGEIMYLWVSNHHVNAFEESNPFLVVSEPFRLCLYHGLYYHCSGRKMKHDSLPFETPNREGSWGVGEYGRGGILCPIPTDINRTAGHGELFIKRLVLHVFFLKITLGK